MKGEKKKFLEMEEEGREGEGGGEEEGEEGKDREGEADVTEHE